MRPYMRRNAKKELHGLPYFIEAVDEVRQVSKFGYYDYKTKVDDQECASFVIEFAKPISYAQGEVIKQFLTQYFNPEFTHKLVITEFREEDSACRISPTYLEHVIWIYKRKDYLDKKKECYTLDYASAALTEWLLLNVYKTCLRKVQLNMHSDTITADVLHLASSSLTDREQRKHEYFKNHKDYIATLRREFEEAQL